MIYWTSQRIHLTIKGFKRIESTNSLTALGIVMQNVTAYFYKPQIKLDTCIKSFMTMTQVPVRLFLH